VAIMIVGGGRDAPTAATHELLSNNPSPVLPGFFD
jgi:hypothetical protein